jgi:hypothetical protein
LLGFFMPQYLGSLYLFFLFKLDKF